MLECWGDYTQIICTEFGLKSVAHGEKQEVPEVFHGFGCYRVEVNRGLNREKSKRKNEPRNTRINTEKEIKILACALSGHSRVYSSWAMVGYYMVQASILGFSKRGRR